MGKVEYTNKVYEYILKSLLISLVLWNSYVLILTLNLKTLIPVLLNSVVLIIVLNRHKITKNVVKLWIVIFFISAPAIVVVTTLIRSFDEIISPDIIIRFAKILFGLFIFIGANRFIEKETLGNLNIDDHLVD